MATNLPPADELASVRRRIADLKERELALRELILGNEALRVGYLSEVKVTVIEQKRLDRKAVAAAGIDLSVFETSETATQLRIVQKESPHG